MLFFHSEALAICKPSFHVQCIQCVIRHTKFLPQAILIIVSTIFLLLLRRLLPISQSTTSIWIRFLLVLEPAIEFPLIFAFHPTVMAYNIGKSTNVPHLDQLVLQVAVFFAVELAFQKCLLRFINIAPNIADENCKSNDSIGTPKLRNSHHEEAEDLVMDFVRPRGTLLLAVALLGMPTDLNRYTGQLHPLAMALWAVFEQLVNCRSLEQE